MVPRSGTNRGGTGRGEECGSGERPRHGLGLQHGRGGSGNGRHGHGMAPVAMVGTVEAMMIFQITPSTKTFIYRKVQQCFVEFY